MPDPTDTPAPLTRAQVAAMTDAEFAAHIKARAWATPVLPPPQKTSEELREIKDRTMGLTDSEFRQACYQRNWRK
jgi:hypothetical protein